MKESKILFFNVTSVRPLQTDVANVSVKDYPAAEQVINEYLAQGWSVSQFAPTTALNFFVVLTR